MKTIGLIGGTTWESTLEYYRIINEAVKLKLGDLYSAKLLLYSFNFAELLKLQKHSGWESISEKFIEAAETLQTAGAEIILICANTMHKVYDSVKEKIPTPILHITDVTAKEILKTDIRKVGLLGTKYTMEEDFYKDRLQNFNIDSIIPDKNERELINKIIYNELCKGIFSIKSKKVFIEIINNLHNRGADGIILGCTEIPLLIKAQDVKIPVFNTTLIHAAAAVNYALK